MAGQERLTVEETAARLGISPDAVRSRIKRGSLWAIRRNGRVLVVWNEQVTQQPQVKQVHELAAANSPSHKAAPEAANLPTYAATNGAAGGTPSGTGNKGSVRSAHDQTAAAIATLRAEIAQHKQRVLDLEREREQLLKQVERQHGFLELEVGLRNRLHDQIDQLSERLAEAMPEILGDPTESADRLWKRLGRQVERVNDDGTERS